MRNDSLSDVLGRSTLPARAMPGQPFGADHAERGVPRTRQQLLGRIVGRRSGALDEGVVVGDAPDLGGGVVRLAHPVLRDLDGEFRDEDRAGLGVLHPVEQHAGDPERRGHHARHVAGVQAVGDDVDPQRARHEPPQRRGDPEPLVVDAPRIEADHEARRADAVGQGLDVERQVGRTRLLARLDEHHAPGVRAARRVHRADRREAGEGGVAVVGTAPPVQPIALEHRRPRTEPLAPPLHLGLLVEVPVQQHGVVVRSRLRSRGSPSGSPECDRRVRRPPA